MKALLGSIGFAALAGIGPGMAADMPIKAPPMPPPALSWTGLYFGVQGGAGWGTTEDAATGFQSCNAGVCGALVSFSPAGAIQSSLGSNGLLGGGTVGANWQTGPVVLGVEGDVSGANIDGNGDCTDSLGLAFNLGRGLPAGCNAKLSWFATATGRLGVVIDRALVFVKGGGAWGHFQESATLGPIANGPGALAAAASSSDTRVGYTVGMGIEYALASNWSAKIEYDYLDFGTKSEVFPFTGTIFGATGVLNLSVNDRERVNVIRAGLNYRFNLGGSAYARY